MKEDLLALRNLGGVALIFAATMLVLWALISQGITMFLVPQPEQSAEQFLQAIAARNYGNALDHLSDELQQQVKEQDLKALAESIDRTQQGIEDAHGQDSRQQGQTSSATTSVKLGNGREQALEFSLRQEHGEWKIASLDPVWELARE